MDSSHKIMGIDLGIKGYFCIIDNFKKIVELQPLPIDRDQGIINTKIWSDIVAKCAAEGPITIAIEQIFLTRCMTGAVNFAQNAGRLIGAIESAGLPLTFYRPIQWQRDMGFVRGVDTKKQSLSMARGLASEYKWTNHNASDAFLIAYYHWMQS